MKHRARNSFILAILILSISYSLMNSDITWGTEKDTLKIMESFRRCIFGESNQEEIDSLFLVDVHYDKCLRVENQLEDSVKSATPDREKLRTFLQYLKKTNDYKCIILDIQFVKALSEPQDTTLYHLIANMERIVIPEISKNTEGIWGKDTIADSCLLLKCGAASYIQTVTDEDFSKYLYISNSEKSMALKLYNEINNKSINNYRLFYTDEGLARKNLLLTYNKLGISQGYERLYKLLLGHEVLPQINEIDFLCKNKYVVIGDLVDDVHSTYLGKMSGPLINYCAYISLIQGNHRMSIKLGIILFVTFFIVSFLALGNNKDEWWWILYPVVLFSICFITYLTMGEIYEIFITTNIFYLIRNRKLFINILNKVKSISINVIKSEFMKAIIERCRCLLPLLIMLLSNPASAQTYQVIAPPHGTIYFGNKKKPIKCFETFNSHAYIKWTRESDYFWARPIGNPQKAKMYSSRRLKKYKANSVFLYEKALGIRGDSHNEHEDDVYGYILADINDTIYFPINIDYIDNMKLYARLDSCNQYYKTPLYLSVDKKYIIVTSDIYKLTDDEQFKIIIEFFSPEDNTTRMLYDSIYILRVSSSDMKRLK